MKLYNVPNNSRIRLDDGTELNFRHIDGMYSYCKTDEGETVHLAAWTEVAVVKEKQNG
jgi:hypothetical protein